ncbi:hypothetical protein [Pedobacter sp. ASV28]|uniref:hypothetical protein n=1 Tax=Pedobacter sp. ASV28 TaxID=2795123 RepID=UPI0018EAE2A1|nr:hypothetical protein [Pedobacter sp. ASV28]
MKKVFNTLKSVNKFALVGILSVAFATMAFKAPAKKTTSTQYGRTSSGWVLVNDDEFECNLQNEEICKAYFLNDPNGPNPQMDNTAPIVRDGLYVPIQP